MNILILFTQPWRVGGAETHVEAMLKGFAGHTVFLAVNEGSQPQKLQELLNRYKNLTLVQIQSRGLNPLRWKKDLVTLETLIIQEKIEVIAAQQRTAGIWAYLLWRRTQVPFTVTMHDPWHRARLKSIYAKIFPRIFVVNQHLAEILKDDFRFQAHQIIAMDNGIDFSEFVPLQQETMREKLGLSATDKIILHVSRLSNTKGAVALKIIASMPRIMEDEPMIKLIIIGEGPLRSEIEKKIIEFNQTWGNRIEIYDFVDHIRDWYNAGDILIGEGRVAIEALACLKPVVAIRNGETFIGLIDSENIQYACDVNFDGKDQAVATENIRKEVHRALLLDLAESKAIADAIKERLGFQKMAEDYIRVFQTMKDKNRMRN